MAQDRQRWRAFADKAMDIRNRRNVRNFVTTRKKRSFSRRGLLFAFAISFPPRALRPNAGHDLLIHEVSRSHQRRTTVGRTPLDE